MSQSILKIANLELPETSVDAAARTAFIDPSQETSRLALRRVHASQFIFVAIRININPALSKIEHLAAIQPAARFLQGHRGLGASPG